MALARIVSSFPESLYICIVTTLFHTKQTAIIVTIGTNKQTKPAVAEEVPNDALMFVNAINIPRIDGSLDQTIISFVENIFHLIS